MGGVSSTGSPPVRKGGRSGGGKIERREKDREGRRDRVGERENAVFCP